MLGISKTFPVTSESIKKQTIIDFNNVDNNHTPEKIISK